MGIDATTKMPPETEHDWGNALESDSDVAAMVERRWAEYGLADLQLGKLTQICLATYALGQRTAPGTQKAAEVSLVMTEARLDL
jgi:hypothetical protein